MFEADFGDPKTESPMRVITPSFVGQSLLPFRCPRCQKVPQALACPFTREHYKDPRPGRDNHHCPLCGCRFKINLRGVQLGTPIQAGAEVGPSRVECGGKITWQDVPPSLPAKILGAIFSVSSAEYRVLARGA